jgi:hypothetical protein
MKGSRQCSGIAPAGTLEEIIRLQIGLHTGDLVLSLFESMLHEFSAINIEQVKFSKVPPDLVERIDLDPGRRISVKDHFI